MIVNDKDVYTIKWKIGASYCQCREDLKQAEGYKLKAIDIVCEQQKDQEKLVDTLKTAMRYFDQVVNESGYASAGEKILHEEAKEVLRSYEERL